MICVLITPAAEAQTRSLFRAKQKASARRAAQKRSVFLNRKANVM